VTQAVILAPADWSVAVVIPARNEEASVERCVHSVLLSARSASQLKSLWVVVVADACSDRTAVLARGALGEHGQVLECSDRSAGSARRLGSAAALDHFAPMDLSRLWIANTDADSHVPADWIAQHLRLAEAGVSAIAGVVEVSAIPGYAGEMAARLTADYELRADGSHPHVHGANLGVRADAYVDAGGWSHLALAEDHCLWRRLGQRGWQRRSTIHSVVATSGRLIGRARGGFADTLRAKIECLGA
jgi:cellulose synthase/poly-beta-1,6-N-acetylglucosamine synthase-like glycosyltransferase